MLNLYTIYIYINNIGYISNNKNTIIVIIYIYRIYIMTIIVFL